MGSIKSTLPTKTGMGQVCRLNYSLIIPTEADKQRLGITILCSSALFSCGGLDRERAGEREVIGVSPRRRQIACRRVPRGAVLPRPPQHRHAPRRRQPVNGIPASGAYTCPFFGSIEARCVG
jgi:hypothetical protein